MIFYFTGTGNSLSAARQIQECFGGALINIAEADRDYKVKKDEITGFVFPVYYWEMPGIVETFLREVQITGSQKEHTFIAVTCGGAAGITCEQAEEILQKKRIAVGYKFGVSMPENYVPLYKMKGEKENRQLLLQARRQIEEFTEHIKKGEQGTYNPCRKPFSSVISPVMGLGFCRSTKKFTSDNTCVGCGKCANICPVQAIEMRKSRPLWVKTECEKCLGCLHRCPAGSINYGMRSRRNGRYYNPDVR